MGKAQVHAFCVLQVEGTLVELGDGVIGIQQRRLLVHFTDDLTGEEREGLDNCKIEGRMERREREGWKHSRGEDRKGKTRKKVSQE